MTHRRPFRLALAALALLAPLGCDSPTGSKGPAAAHLDVVSGDLQTQTVGKELAQPLVVKVTDDKGHAVKGQIVNFRVTAGGGAVFAGAALTDNNGEARERWTLGTVAADSQKVEARAVDPTTGAALLFATFRAVATADVPSSIGPAGAMAFTGLPLLALADSVAAVVRDVYGNPVPGAAVVWTVKQGGGSVSPGTSTTGADGVARTSWTLGAQLDSLQVIEAAAGLTLKTQFTANGRVPSDAVVVKVSGDAQTGTAGQILAQPLVVRVQRANGTPVAGIPVTFTLPAASGSVTPTTMVSNAAGQVSVQWTLGTGVGAMSATAAISTGASATFGATSVAGAAASLQKVSGDGQSARAGSVLADSLVVRAADAYGNAVAGVAITWSAPSGSVSPATAATRADGTAHAAYTLPAAAGAATVTASATGLTPVSFTEAATATAVYMTILAPAANAVAGDSVIVTVRIDSASASVQSVVAEAGGNSVVLGPGTFPGVVTNKLPLVGTPRGALTLKITATTVNGDSSVLTRTIIHDTPPSVSSPNPANGTVARPGLRIDADCADDDPAGCASTVATVRAIGPGTGLVQVASGTTGIHQTVSLAPYQGQALELAVTGTDSRAQKRSTVDTVYVESAASLVEVFSGGSHAWDADSTRFLFADSAGSLYLRSGGSDALVAANALPRIALLHPYGAVFSNSTGYDWHPGTLTSLGPVNSQLWTKGQWAIWSNGTTLYRRDLAAGVTTQVATDAINIFNDLAPNGDVVYAAGTSSSANRFDIYRWSGGSATPLTADADSVYWNVWPVTDGTSVLYFKSDQLGRNTLQAGRIALWKGGVETILSSQFQSAEPPRNYDANGGWIAWTTQDAGGVIQVHTRAPDGTDRLATSLGTSSELRALSPGGSVVYSNGGSLYVVRAPYTAPRVLVSHDWGNIPVRFRGDELLFLLGRTVFRVSY